MNTKLASIGNALHRSFHRAKFKVSTHSPEILVVAGVVGTVAAVVTACKATIKAEKIVEEHKEMMAKIEAVTEDPKKYDADYDAEQSRKDKITLYVQTAAKLAKVYAVPFVIMLTSIGAILYGHDILRKRNAAIAAAYGTLKKGFDEYRKRVADEIGEDKENLLWRGIKAVELEEHGTDEEGRDITTKKTLMKQDKPASPYSFLFDEINSNQWDKHPGYNTTFLSKMEQEMDRELKRRGVGGVLFLNEVLLKLGFDPVYEGQEVGWIFDPNNPAVKNKVSFGIWERTDDCKINAFRLGQEPSVWLTFNVDGIVRDMLPKKTKGAVA